MFRGPFNSLTKAVLCATALALTSCGGGGGGGTGSTPTPSSPPPPPPPPANVAPSATVTVDDAAPQEGQYFTLDASATTDADTDPLTFSWVQTAGPTVDIPDATLDVLADLRVPELTATETATFELTVSDGTDSSVVSVDVDFTNIHQMPRYALDLPLAQTVTFTASVEAAFSNAFWGQPTYLGFAADPGDDISLLELSLTDLGELTTLVLNQVTESFRQPVKFASTIYLSTVASRSQFYALEESQDRLSAYIKPDDASPFAQRGTLQIAAPCDLYEPAGGGRISIGQRHNGFSLVARSQVGDTGTVPFDLYQKVGTSESFCALRAVRDPLTGPNFVDNDYRFLEDMLALDTDTNTLHVFEQDDNVSVDTIKYRFRASAVLDLQTTETLTFVKATFIPEGLAMVFTDGVHKGVHRLVVAGLDEDRKIVQQTYSWPIGVPSDIFASNLDLDPYSNVIILTETSPDAVIFTGQPVASTIRLPLTGPEYFEIGLGATLGYRVGLGFPGPVAYLLISDREDKEVRAYGPLP